MIAIDFLHCAGGRQTARFQRAYGNHIKRSLKRGETPVDVDEFFSQWWEARKEKMAKQLLMKKFRNIVESTPYLELVQNKESVG